jgi:hypothetical protein
MTKVAIGLRDHSGWAVAVAVADGAGGPRVVERRRLRLCDPDLPRQAYHAAVGLPLDEARELVVSVEQSAVASAKAELADLVGELRAGGHRVVAVGIPVVATQVPDDLATILGSHPLLHAAEGELYREALAEAADAASLTAVRFMAKGVLAETAASLGIGEAALTDRLAALGRGLGPPWAADQKHAAAAALLALHAAR